MASSIKVAATETETANKVPDTDKYRAPALDKGLDILELLASHAYGLTQVEISRSLGRSANELYRMLDRLVRRGYVVKPEPGERYHLSLKLFALAHRHPPVERLAEAAAPIMRSVADSMEQSVQLAVYDRGAAVVVAQTNPPGTWAYSIRRGAEVSLFNTGSGHVLLAFQSERRRAQMLAEHRPVEGEVLLPITELEERVKAVQQRGYEYSQSAQVEGVINLSAPVLDHDGRALAAMTIPYLRRIDTYKIPSTKEATKILLEGAQALSYSVASSASDYSTPDEPEKEHT